MERNFDVVIIGGGAAGLSAALVLGRARRRVALIDAGEPRNAPAAHMQGFLSRDGMPPAELVSAGRAEVSNYGVEIIEGRVVSTTAGFTLELAGGRTVHARHVLLATGATDELPDVPGVKERWGRDFLHCPYCHGWEVRDQPIGVLSSGPSSVEYTHLLRQWSDDVVLFTHTQPVTAEERDGLQARGIDVVDGVIERLVIEDDRLQGLALAGGEVVARTAVFMRPAVRGHRESPVGALGCEHDPEGLLKVDPSGRTSVPGVWAAGNATNPRAQVITAAGEGSAVAIAINTELVTEDVKRAARDTQRHDQPGEPMTKIQPAQVPPPNRHHLALMIWLCVFPTLTAINVALSDQLSSMSPVLRTFVLATVAVPIVIYGLMPHAHRARARLLMRRTEVTAR